MLFDVIRQPRNLLVAVLRRNCRQNWLVKSAACYFDLANRHKRSKQIEVFRMGAFNPFKKRARIVQPHAYRRMPGQEFHERQIGFLVRPLKHIVEVAYRLMCVYQQNEFEFRHSATSEALQQDNRFWMMGLVEIVSANASPGKVLRRWAIRAAMIAVS